MADNSWRQELDLLIEENLNELVKETKEYDYAIKESSNKGKAQIWVALALLNHKINQLHMESEEYQKKLPPEEIDKIISSLENL